MWLDDKTSRFIDLEQGDDPADRTLVVHDAGSETTDRIKIDRVRLERVAHSHGVETRLVITHWEPAETT